RITVEGVCAGQWRARDASMQAYSLGYVSALKGSGKAVLTIWPEHCLIGSWGHNVHPDVAAALQDWEKTYAKAVKYVWKGTNPLTEHYSAITAELVLANDPSTAANIELLTSLNRADTILVAGEAQSHCVAGTIQDVVK